MSPRQTDPDRKKYFKGSNLRMLEGTNIYNNIIFYLCYD